MAKIHVYCNSELRPGFKEWPEGSSGGGSAAAAAVPPHEQSGSGASRTTSGTEAASTVKQQAAFEVDSGLAEACGRMREEGILRR